MSDSIKQALATLLTGIWCLQLLTLSPVNFSPEEQQYGNVSIAEVTATRTNPPRLAPLPATMSAQNRMETLYDSVFFVGDVLLGRNVEYLMNTKGGNYPFAGFDVMSRSQSPAVVLNFESAVPATHIVTKPLGMRFSTPVSALAPLRAAGVTHASLANNHSFDFGRGDYFHTQAALEAESITMFGNPTEISSTTVSYLQVEDSMVALIGLSAVSGWDYSAADIAELFASTETQSDYQFVSIHWGVEYEEMSSSLQQSIAAELVSAGADAIIGHHPHVIQEIEYVDGVPVFYSLGNYIFDQYFSASVQTGLVLQFIADDQPGFYLQAVSSIEQLSQPQPLKPLAQDAFLEDLALRSTSTAQAAVRQGFVPLRPVATSSKIAMID